MKRVIALLLILIMLFSLTACGNHSAEKSVAAEAVEHTFEDSLEGISYRIPDDWRREEFSSDVIKQKMYYLDETNDNCVMAMLITADNTFLSFEQAEQYMDIFMEGFYSEMNGFSDGTFSPYTANVPARHGTCKNSGNIDVEVYAYLPTEKSVFTLSNWHISDSDKRISSSDFSDIASTVLMPDFTLPGLSGNAANSNNNRSQTFTNKYGTSTTKCSRPDCDNYIASSGDTNCCAAHSSKCLNCGCYIDSDAMYCMSCLSGNVSSKSSSGSGKTSGCQYEYPDGSICGAKCTDYPSMCNSHFEMLNSIYKSLTG